MPELRRPLAAAARFLLCPRLASSLPSSSIFKHSTPSSSPHQLIVISVLSSESSTSSRAFCVSRQPDPPAVPSSSFSYLSSNKSGSVSADDAACRPNVTSPSFFSRDGEACLITRQACDKFSTNFAFAGATVSPSSRGLHSSSAAAGAECSSKHPSSPTGHQGDGDDWRQWTEQSSRSKLLSSTLDSPGNRPAEADEEVTSGLHDSVDGGAREYPDESEDDRDDAYEFSDEEISVNAGSKGSVRRPLPDYDGEVIVEFVSTSESSTDESDGWDLNFGEGGLRTAVGSEGQLEAEGSLRRGSLSVTSSELDLSQGKENEFRNPELLEPSNVDSTYKDSGEGAVEVSEPLHEAGEQSQNGRPYLHTLSVAAILEILEKARAKDVSSVGVRESCEWVDYLVFASGRSFRHLSGLADALVYNIKRSSTNFGTNNLPLVEGREGEQWMVVDCGNVVVHLFLEEARSYYNLEEFWREKSRQRLIQSS